ncbi:ABC transporter substrate-binding protein [Streptomyces chiangmaiensis]|uniref:Sugar ABC transporter substrate-binding protein n=1 Tax=Streptomyces chiangmaiensis TaxID=766497 RepID=A0ABU7FUJ8_9ACTN|nr:sugar ABC transporter substrate-binding protein [Streptomyces chiangmaiensis]MED7827575.1 sugar ABC transporter substrate-binding protein [Streptomyces chiangmaiensis]
MVEGRTHEANRRRFLQMLGAGAAVPLLGGLAGCSNSGGALGGGSAASGKVTELVVPTSQSPWLGAYRKLAAKYQEKTGIKITLREFPYDGLYTQMTNAVHGGNFPFDVFQLDEFGVGQFYSNQWVQSFDAVDQGFKIDPQVITYANLPFWDAATRSSTPEGKVMGYPINGNMDLFVYRKDIYSKLGLSVPKTWDEAIANGQKAVDSGKIRYGYVPRAQATQSGLSVTYEFMPVFYSYGGAWFKDAGTDWTPTVNTPAGIKAATVYRELAKLGPKQPQTIGQAEVISLMQGGQVLQTHVVAAAASQFQDKDKSQIADAVGFAEVPAGSTGTPAPTSGTWSLCIPKGLSSDRAAAALDYIKWVVSDEAQTLFTQAGGIPTRRSALSAGASSGTAASYLEPLEESVKNVKPSIRWTFGPAMSAQTEKYLSQIAASQVTPEAGMAALQDALAKVVKDAGYLK